MKMFFVRALRCCGAVVVAGLAVGCPDQSPAGPAEMSIDAGDAQTTVTWFFDGVMDRAENYDALDLALARADEVKSVLMRAGWREP